MPAANPLRGEATLIVGGRAHVLRPSFAALVAAEEELGSLFALVERAGEGRLLLSEMATLFWHCLADPGETSDAGPGHPVERRMLTDNLGLFLAIRTQWRKAAGGVVTNVTAAGARALDGVSTP